tara:strand:+ start:214 stop:813 length:600 start_codon:yes stop_codon:yes gene_type:complete
MMRALQAGGRLAFTVPGAVIAYLTARKVAPEWTEKKVEEVMEAVADAGKDTLWAVLKPLLKQLLPVFIVILFAVAAWRMLPTTDTTNKVARRRNKTGIVKVTTWVSFVGVVLGVMLQVAEFAKTMTLPDFPEFPSITVNPLYVWYAGYIAVALCVAFRILKCCVDRGTARDFKQSDARRYNKKQRFERNHRKKYPERYD